MKRFCNAVGNDFVDVPISGALWTDVTQALARQQKSGKVTMLCGSKLYNYYRDRSTCHRDHFKLQGWPSDVDLSHVGDGPTDAFLEWQRAQDTEKKRRRSKRSEATSSRELAGSAMCLPDIGMINLCGLLAANNNLFQHPPPAQFTVSPVLSVEQRKIVKNTILDPADMDAITRHNDADNDELFADVPALGGLGLDVD